MLRIRPSLFRSKRIEQPSWASQPWWLRSFRALLRPLTWLGGKFQILGLHTLDLFWNIATRPRAWKHLIFGIPSILGFVVIFALSVNTLQKSRLVMSDYYVSAVERMKSGDKSESLLLIQRMLREGWRETEAKLMLAEIYREEGYADRSQSILRSLAPDNAVGNPVAHRYRALAYSEAIERGQLLTPADVTHFQWHLNHASENHTAMMEACWGWYYLAIDDRSAAIKSFQLACLEYPRYYSLLARLYRAENQPEEAIRAASNSAEYLYREVDRAPRDITLRQQLFGSLVEARRLDEAEEVLRVGIALYPKGPFQTHMANLQCLIHDAEASQDDADIKRLLARLRYALSFDVRSIEVEKRLDSYVQSFSESPDSTKILDAFLADGDQPGIAHYLLARISSDLDATKSLWHLRTAILVDPHLWLARRKLIDILAGQSPTDLSECQKLYDEAKALHSEVNFEIFVDNVEFYLAHDNPIEAEKLIDRFEPEPDSEKQISKTLNELRTRVAQLKTS